MFRDAQEELKRLEQQLLEEEQDDVLPPDAPESDTDLDSLLQEADPAPGGSVVYCNFSNDYGKSLCNYATGYQAYNSDRVDQDPEELGEAVRNEDNSLPLWLPILALVLTGVVVALIAWICWDMGVLF